jgi:hypothetical protein
MTDTAAQSPLKKAGGSSVHAGGVVVGERVVVVVKSPCSTRHESLHSWQLSQQ